MALLHGTRRGAPFSFFGTCFQNRRDDIGRDHLTEDVIVRYRNASLAFAVPTCRAHCRAAGVSTNPVRPGPTGPSIRPKPPCQHSMVIHESASDHRPHRTFTSPARPPSHSGVQHSRTRRQFQNAKLQSRNAAPAEKRRYSYVHCRSSYSFKVFQGNQ